MSKKIVFMGTPGFAVPCLEALNNSNHKVISVYSQPASKANRGQKLVKSKIGKTPIIFSSITKKGIKELITELFIQSGKNDY